MTVLYPHHRRKPDGDAFWVRRMPSRRSEHDFDVCARGSHVVHNDAKYLMNQASGRIVDRAVRHVLEWS